MTKRKKKRYTGIQLVYSYFWGNCIPLKSLYLGKKTTWVYRYTVIYY